MKSRVSPLPQVIATVVLALAMMPIMQLATGADLRSTAVRAEQIEPATICQTLAECAVVATAEAPETILQ